MIKNSIVPIGYVKSDFKEKFGIPRQSGRANNLRAEIIFEKPFRNLDAFRGIEGFSHLWLLFDFSKAHFESNKLLVRPPRLGGNKKVGVFASRSPFRPNNIGLSSVEFIELKQTDDLGPVLVVAGADLLDGTPIYDIKPYLPFTDSHPNAKCGYAENSVDYKLKIEIPKEFCKFFSSDKLCALEQCLADDPRPSYQEDGKIYGMSFAGVNIKFTVCNQLLTVISAEKE